MKTKPFKFKDEQGNEQVIMLRALPVKDLPVLWDIRNKISSNPLTKEDKLVYEKFNKGEDLTDEEQKILINIDKKTTGSLTSEDIGNLGNLCESTLKKSRNGISDSEVEYIISEYFFELYPDILALNFSKENE